MAILTYHHIGKPPDDAHSHRGLWVAPEAFAGHLRWLSANGYAAVGLDAVAEALSGLRPLPRRWVCITFDDGWRDNFTRALPALQAHGYTATVFVVTGWIRTGPPADDDTDTLSADELRAMASVGITIGSHTATHPRLTSLDDEAIRAELTASRSALADILGSPPRWLCYPYGNCSERVERIARESGYSGAVSTIRDNRVRPDQLFRLPRVMVMNDTTPARLGYMLSWLYHAEHMIKNRRRWRGRA
ncbi:MAG: polysaccharide deacetylase family protein [Candidatus Sumerlaeaceae bacterium]|nr:polysaccharide deacetylase family protein [Candidatus Sumerlaeaceae bacterium]